MLYFSQKTWTFCREASLPFPGEVDCGCGITLDIFTHVLHGFIIFCFIYLFIYFFATILQKCKCTYDDLVDGYNVAHLQYKTIQNIDRIV